MLQSTFRVLAAGLLAIAAISAHAQIPNIFPGGSGAARSPDGGDPRGRRPDAPDYRQYEYGREIYAVKLGCSTCPLGDRELNEETAREYLTNSTLWDGLEEKEHEAVAVYLRQLFTLFF